MNGLIDKKWLLGILTSVFVISSLVAFRDRLPILWALPEKVNSIEEKLDGYDKEQSDIQKLVLEQHARQNTQEQISKVQIEALNQQLLLLADLKKKSK